MTYKTILKVNVFLPLSLVICLLLSVHPSEAFIDINFSVNTKLYHSYDGLVCYDCHTIHNSENGAQIINSGGPYPRLLKQRTVTDICLQCHIFPASFAFKAPSVMTVTGTPPPTISMPSGDFYWSMIDSKKGHNPGKSLGIQSIIMPTDSTLTVSPGGSYSIDDWDCASCHDPHNRFGADVASWRQLRRKVNNIVHTGNETVAFGVESYGGDQGATAAGYEPIKSNSRGDIRGGVNDTNYLNTRADGNPREGAILSQAESDINKNVYRGGFSSFCSTCHGDFHGGNSEAEATANANTNPDANGRWVKHPTNLLMADKTTTGPSSRKYGTGSYTAVITNTQSTNPNPAGYDYRYPLIQADDDFNLTVTGTGTTITDATIDSSRISCLTCHKAHASKYDNMTRWDNSEHSFIADGATDFTGAASNGDNPAYGCGKCHQKGGAKAFVKTF